MTSRTVRPARAPLLNTLLGVVLVLVAALDVVMAGAIGWAGWQRATLSEYRYRMHLEDPRYAQGDRKEVEELRAQIAYSRESITSALRALPRDADAASLVSGLSAQAAVMGVTIVELSPLTTGPASVPSRCFTVRARGATSALLGFLTLVARTSLPASQLQGVSLQQDGQSAELTFVFKIFVRPPDETSAGVSRDSQAVALP